MKPLFNLIKLLSASEKRNLALLTVAMVVVAVFEVLGVGAVGPFISVAADPAVIETNAILSSVYEALAFESTRGFLVFLGVGFFALVVAANSLTTFVMYWVFRWSHMRGYSLAV